MTLYPVHSLLKDITELKRLQEKEKESVVLAERAAIIDAMLDGVLIHDPGGKIISANKSLEDMTGYKAEELIGKSIFDFFKLEELNKFKVALTELLEEGKVGPIELNLSTKDGRKIPIQTVSSLTRDAQGNPAYGVAVIRDITERKQAEETLRSLIRDTLDAQEAERERICLEVHDGVAQTLASAFQYLQAFDSIPDTQAGQAKHLTGKATSLVKQAIQEAREVINSLQPATLGTLGLVPTLRQEISELKKDTGWRIDFVADNVRPSKDIETALYRIIHEALTNVRKHADANRVRIELRCSDKQFVVQVKDWGKGFKPEQWWLWAGRQGTGLHSIRRRAELVGGECEIESNPGHGTVVMVKVPVAEGGDYENNKGANR